MKNKKVIYGVVAVGIFIVGIIILFLYSLNQADCDTIANKAENLFKEANYCQKDDDCKFVRFEGPYSHLGCGIFVNKSYDTRMIFENKKITRYINCLSPFSSRINCDALTSGVCENNKCTRSQDDTGSQISNQCGGYEGKKCQEGYYCDAEEGCMDCYGICKPINIQNEPIIKTENQIQNTTKDQLMNKSVCIQQGGLWGQHENLWDDGRFDMFFACTCPQEKSNETRIVPEGSSSNCK